MAKGFYKEHYTNDKLLEAMTKKNAEVALVCSRGRSLGKTFSFVKTFVEHFEETGEKVILMCRTQNQVGEIADGIMKGYLEVKRPGYFIKEVRKGYGVYGDVLLCHMEDEEIVKEHMGYVIPLNAADKIKTISSKFVDSWCMFFDEFQPESGRYLPDEVNKLMSIHTSVARGGGQSRRFFPIYLCSNSINIFNPYFVAMGLTSKIQPNTRVYGEEGKFVYERCHVEGLSTGRKLSGAELTFGGTNVYDDDNSWLTADDAIICKPDNWGRSVYIATLLRGSESYGVHLYPQVGYMYVSRTIDKTSSYVYNMSLEDGNLNVPFIRSTGIFKQLRSQFELGMVRVQDGGVKDIIFNLFV